MIRFWRTSSVTNGLANFRKEALWGYWCGNNPKVLSRRLAQITQTQFPGLPPLQRIFLFCKEYFFQTSPHLHMNLCRSRKVLLWFFPCEGQRPLTGVAELSVVSETETCGSSTVWLCFAGCISRINFPLVTSTVSLFLNVRDLDLGSKTVLAASG